MTPRLVLLGDSLKLGGTESQFAEIACGLNRSRWEIDVGCLRAEGPLRARLEATGIHAWSCGPPSLKSPHAALAVLRLARHLRARRIQLIHSFDFYSNVLGVLAARLARLPVIAASQRDLGDLRPPLQSRIHRSILRLAHYVLVNSKAVADRLAHDRVVPADRIVVIPNGVDVTRFSPRAGLDRRAADFTRVGTLANLRPEKGLADIIHAASIAREYHPNVHFIIWGDGPLRQELQRLIQAHDLSRWVELRGATTDPPAALRELDIFVLASHSEACPNVLLEAMAARLPAIATSVGGNPAIVQDQETGLLVPPGDPAGLAKAILRLIEDPQLAAELAARGLDKVRREFTVGRMLDRFQAFYDYALSRNAP